MNWIKWVGRLMALTGAVVMLAAIIRALGGHGDDKAANAMAIGVMQLFLGCVLMLLVKIELNTRGIPMLGMVRAGFTREQQAVATGTKTVNENRASGAPAAGNRANVPPPPPQG